MLLALIILLAMIVVLLVGMLSLVDDYSAPLWCAEPNNGSGFDAPSVLLQVHRDPRFSVDHTLGLRGFPPKTLPDPLNRSAQFVNPGTGERAPIH